MNGEAELLRKAAALVRQRADAATPGPWTFTPAERPGTSLGVGVLSYGQGRHEAPHNAADAAWKALMGPQVAELLATWLDNEAESAEEHCPRWRYKRFDGWDGEYGDPWIKRPVEEYEGFVRGAFGRSLALARALLGEDPS